MLKVVLIVIPSTYYIFINYILLLLSLLLLLLLFSYVTLKINRFILLPLLYISLRFFLKCVHVYEEGVALEWEFSFPLPLSRTFSISCSFLLFLLYGW